MEILLSANQPPDENIRWFNHIGIFDKSILEHEATKIICDNFLSKVGEEDFNQMMQIIYSKMRIKCQLVIKELDLYSISKYFYRNSNNISDINMKITSPLRSFVSIEKIQNSLPEGFVVTKKFIEDQDLSFVLCIERAT